MSQVLVLIWDSISKLLNPLYFRIFSISDKNSGGNYGYDPRKRRKF
jgi:hypothetical protein